jgi:hypothetical protein
MPARRGRPLAHRPERMLSEMADLGAPPPIIRLSAVFTPETPPDGLDGSHGASPAGFVVALGIIRLVS